MEITQETIDQAAQQENDLLQREMQEQRNRIMNDRIVVLKAYSMSLEKLLEEHDIDYTIQQQQQDAPPAPPKKKAAPRKKAAPKKKADQETPV